MRQFTPPLLTLLLAFSTPLGGSAQVEARHSKPRRQRRKRRKRGRKNEVWNKTPQLLKRVKVITQPIKGQDLECVARLRAYGVKFQLLKGAKGVHTPVRLLQTKLGGVHYRRAWNNKKAPWILNCKMVENLILAGKQLRRYGIASLYWTSAWRYSFVHGTRKLSKHANGNALDITAMDGSFGYASLVSHWSNACKGCGTGCASRKARALKAFKCAVKHKGLFRTVYSPAYNARHRDHFHVDSPNPKFKLKVKISPIVAKNVTPLKKKGGVKRKRHHWSSYSYKRKWEPCRSRPYRW